MELKFEKVDINRFDELNIFNNDDFKEYKTSRIKLIQDGKCDVLVAILDNKYIGEVTVKYFNGTLDNETVPNVRVYLEAFRICDGYQGKGIGQQFLNYVLKYFESLGYTEFTIGVEEDNENAKHIYQKFGFINPINTGFDKYANENYTLYLRDTKILENKQKI